MRKPTRLYWDSCAWLGLINGEPEKKRELGIIYSGAERNFYELWTSAVSLTEVFRLKDEEHEPKPLTDEKLSILDDLFLQPFVKVLPHDIETGRLGRKIYRETPGLRKKWDAVHIATALRANLEVMHTYDHKDLLHLSGTFRCRNGNPLTICYPDETTDGPLLAKRA